VPARRRKSEAEPIRRRPATTPEARENEMVSLAHDVAEEQMRNGTASSQVITHFLKLGSTREQLEQQKLEFEAQLAQAKIEAIAQQGRMEELYKDAISAMKMYTGSTSELDQDVEN